MSTKKSRTTYNQLEAMVNYLEQNKELLLNKGSKKNSEKWTELCNILNCLGRGPFKSAKEWKRVLIEWKYNTKRRLKTNFTGKRLSDAEERLLKLLSEIPNEDIDPSEIQFVQVLIEENNSENQIEVKIEPVENEIKAEIELSANIEETHLNVPENISANETEEINNTEFLPPTSNSVLVNQIKVTDQSNEISKIPVTNNDHPATIIETCSKKPLKYKRRELKQQSNVLRKKVSRNIAENAKTYNLLTNAVFKLAESNRKIAESNYKVAESNYKIAESNEKLAEALHLYVKQI